MLTFVRSYHFIICLKKIVNGCLIFLFYVLDIRRKMRENWQKVQSRTSPTLRVKKVSYVGPFAALVIFILG